MDHKTNFRLLEKNFTPTEATEIISSLIDEQINLCKLRYWKQWEGDHSTDIRERDQKIAELNDQKKKLTQMIMQAQLEGGKVNIENLFEVKLAS